MGKKFFKKRGDYLLVATSKTKNFRLCFDYKEKNILVIDLIVTSKKYRKKSSYFFNKLY